MLDKRRLDELVKDVDPLEQLDEDVEEVCSSDKFRTNRHLIKLTFCTFAFLSVDVKMTFLGFRCCFKLQTILSIM